MKIVGKISVKTVCGNVPTQDAKAPKMANGVVVLDKDGAPIMETVQRGIKQDLMRVFGQCDKIKLGNTAFGETVEFQGSFEATDILTGEVYRGSRLFLPPVLQDMVRAQVVAASTDENGDPKDANVQFAFDIGADSANTPHGYQYTITPLTAPSANDPLAAMKLALLGNAPALKIGGKVVGDAPKVEAQGINSESAVEKAANEAASKKK